MPKWSFWNLADSLDHGVLNSFARGSTVLVFSDYAAFAVLQSSIHEVWARTYGATLRTDMMYSPTDCFENYPFPGNFGEVLPLGESYHAKRCQIMQAHQEGLTNTYNRFNNPNEDATDIADLRQLHTQMDQAVALAYGWTDINLNHDFHRTDQGLRFTIHEAARREVLDRLLALNHERYAEEVAAGLHDKGKQSNTKKARKKSSEGYYGKQLRMGF